MVRLGDICTQITDGSHNPPVSVGESSYLMLSSKNIDDDSITLDDPRYLSKDDFDTENKRTNIEPDDLLMTIVGTIGRVAIVPNELTKICVQRSVAVLKPKSDIVYNRFLMYYLQNMRPYLEQESRGVAQKGIYLKQIGNLTISLPPIDEQRKIAAVLDKVSDLIAKRRQQLDKLDLLIKARFVEMFDLSACTYGMLSDTTEFVDYRGHTPTLSDDGNIRMVNAKSVGKGVFKYVEEYVTEKTYDSWMHRGFGYPGDVLFVTEGHTFGNACQVPQGLTKFALGQRVITIQGHRGIINNAFLCAYMQTDKFIKDIAMYKTGGTAQGIRSKDLGKVEVPLYPYAQQETFENFVDQTEKTKTTISKSLEKLETLKKALMQEYFG